MDDQGTRTILEQRRRSRLVLFPLPFQGHINPMLQLANILHSKGFSISIIHTEHNFPNPSKYPHFTFHSIFDDLIKSGGSASEPFLIVKLLNQTCAEPFRECLDQILSSDHVKCIITDAHWYFTQELADNLKLPRIVIRTTSICSFLAFAALSVLREKGYLSNKDMEEPVEEMPPLKVKDIPRMETCNPGDVYQVVSDMVEVTKKASGLIFNTFKELEESELIKVREGFLMPIFIIGPFHKYFSAASSSFLEQDRSSITWLDAQAPKSVLYVSFGSIASMDARKLHEMAWGLADSMQPFLWVVRPGLATGSEWLEILPDGFLESIGERGYIIKWAPQQEILSHPSVGGFWTHSGWNSTLESICEGVPMICSQFFGDQMVNSRYVSDVWKVGIKLEKGLERAEIKKAVITLMQGREGEEMMQRVLRLKEEIQLSLKLGGSSYQSLDELVELISSF